ncbi:MAG TPA: NAD(P)/FAD-dependent oxidoreductase [bacterium]
MKKVYDVAVVGGGPIGSYTAYQLAGRGFKVCVLDEKKIISEGVICSGIISKEAFRRFDLPRASILTDIDSFRVVSPGGQTLEYRHQSPFAHIVDREKFNEDIMEKAREKSAQIYLDHRVDRIDKTGDFYMISHNGAVLQSKAVILATGIKYDLHAASGLGKPSKFLYGSQTEIPLSMPISTIEVHLGQSFAPGSFGWIAPLHKDTSRVGVIAEEKGKHLLMRMLRERINYPASKIKINMIKSKPIVFGPIKPSVNGMLLAVGEAAGQVKTTTGGGIFFGLLCSEIAVDKLTATLKGKYVLNEYETAWRQALHAELEIGMELRKIAGILGDKQVENLLSFIKKNPVLIKWIIPHIKYDFHSNFLLDCLKGFQSLLGSWQPKAFRNDDVTLLHVNSCLNSRPFAEKNLEPAFIPSGSWRNPLI